ncbi:MAG: hypothetical protein NVS2B15_27410 [Pseudarthrobacter sp.]
MQRPLQAFELQGAQLVDAHALGRIEQVLLRRGPAAHCLATSVSTSYRATDWSS